MQQAEKVVTYTTELQPTYTKMMLNINHK